jgi:hypothetical protein
MAIYLHQNVHKNVLEINIVTIQQKDVHIFVHKVHLLIIQHGIVYKFVQLGIMVKLLIIHVKEHVLLAILHSTGHVNVELIVYRNGIGMLIIQLQLV